MRLSQVKKKELVEIIAGFVRAFHLQRRLNPPWIIHEVDKVLVFRGVDQDVVELPFELFAGEIRGKESTVIQYTAEGNVRIANSPKGRRNRKRQEKICSRT